MKCLSLPVFTTTIGSLDHFENQIPNLILIWIIGEDGYIEALWTIISAGEHDHVKNL